MTGWRRWGWQQLSGLLAVALGVLVAGLVDDELWARGTWVVFLGAWVVVTGAQALVRWHRLRTAAGRP